MRINFELKDLDQYDLIYLSLGAGVQSSCLFYMACIGDPIMPKIDHMPDLFDNECDGICRFMTSNN